MYVSRRGEAVGSILDSSARNSTTSYAQTFPSNEFHLYFVTVTTLFCLFSVGCKQKVVLLILHFSVGTLVYVTKMSNKMVLYIHKLIVLNQGVLKSQSNLSLVFQLPFLEDNIQINCKTFSSSRHYVGS